MKKIISSILAVAMLLALCLTCFTGCGGGNKAIEFVMPEGGFDTSKPVTIKFYHMLGSALREIMDQAIADFNKIYPNITIVHDSYGDYDGVLNQIKSEITVGGQPNLAYCYPDHVAFYNTSGAVQPLDVFLNSQYGFTDEEKANLGNKFFNEGKVFGSDTTYTMPVMRSTEVLFYNKTFFTANGLTPPTTWDDMAALCEDIREINNTIIPLGYDSEANWFITMCEQYGSGYTSATGENFLFDNDTNKTFAETFNTWYKNKWVTTKALNGNAYTSNLFKEQKIMMCIGSTGGSTYQMAGQTNGVSEFEVGIVPIPQVDPANPKVISQGPSICVFKDADPQEVLASWLFAKFLVTDINFQARVSMNNGYSPVNQAVKQNEVYADFLADTTNVPAQAIAVALQEEERGALYFSPAFSGSSVAREQVGLLLQACMSSTKTGSELTADIAQLFKNAVAECKYQSGQ